MISKLTFDVVDNELNNPTKEGRKVLKALISAGHSAKIMKVFRTKYFNCHEILNSPKYFYFSMI